MPEFSGPRNGPGAVARDLRSQLYQRPATVRQQRFQVIHRPQGCACQRGTAELDGGCQTPSFRRAVRAGNPMRAYRLRERAPKFTETSASE